MCLRSFKGQPRIFMRLMEWRIVSARLFENDRITRSTSGNLKGTGGAGPPTYGNPAEVGFG
jgi:hypothetical protein